MPLLSFIENGIFHFITLSNTAFMEDFLLYHFVENGRYQKLPLLLYRFIETAFIKNGLFHLIALSLCPKWPLLAFIKNGLFALSLYHFV